LCSPEQFIEVVLTTFVVNLHHLLLSASISPCFRSVSRKWIPLLSFQLTDETFAVGIKKFNGQPGDPWYQLGLNNAAYTAWFLGSLVGVVMGGHLPTMLNRSLSFALPAMFVGLLFLQIKRIGDLWVVGSAAILSTVFYLTGSRSWNIILAALLASLIGMIVERWTEDYI
jgi:predicted branched-subunit amino acid permease